MTDEKLDEALNGEQMITHDENTVRSSINADLTDIHNQDDRALQARVEDIVNGDQIIDTPEDN